MFSFTQVSLANLIFKLFGAMAKAQRAVTNSTQVILNLRRCRPL